MYTLTKCYIIDNMSTIHLYLINIICLFDILLIFVFAVGVLVNIRRNLYKKLITFIFCMESFLSIITNKIFLMEIQKSINLYISMNMYLLIKFCNVDKIVVMKILWKTFLAVIIMQPLNTKRRQTEIFFFLSLFLRESVCDNRHSRLYLDGLHVALKASTAGSRKKKLFKSGNFYHASLICVVSSLVLPRGATLVFNIFTYAR